MRKTGVLGISVAVVFVVAGCSAFRAMGGGSTNVSRDIDVTASGSGCSFTGTVDQISIGNGNSGTLVFHVKPANSFKFTDNGIDFSKSGAPAGEFAKTNSSDTTWTIHDRNKTRGSFKYEVNVVPKAPGGQACNLDPTVLNDGTCQDGC